MLNISYEDLKTCASTACSDLKSFQNSGQQVFLFAVAPRAFIFAALVSQELGTTLGVVYPGEGSTQSQLMHPQFVVEPGMGSSPIFIYLDCVEDSVKNRIQEFHQEYFSFAEFKYLTAI